MTNEELLNSLLESVGSDKFGDLKKSVLERMDACGWCREECEYCGNQSSQPVCNDCSDKIKNDFLLIGKHFAAGLAEIPDTLINSLSMEEQKEECREYNSNRRLNPMLANEFHNFVEAFCTNLYEDTHAG
jgi:hypothetical protein